MMSWLTTSKLRIDCSLLQRVLELGVSRLKRTLVCHV